jgi:hypothetical protein
MHLGEVGGVGEGLGGFEFGQARGQGGVDGLVGVAAQGESARRGCVEGRGDVQGVLEFCPELVRLTQWTWLERVDASAEEEGAYRLKAKALVAASGDALTEVQAIDTLLLVIGLSTAWNMASPGVRAIGGAGRTARVRAHRAAVVAAATAVVDALT